MKKILLLCLFLFSISLSYGGSITPEPAENDEIENVLIVDLNTVAPVAVKCINFTETSKLLVRSERPTIYNEVKKTTNRERHTKTIYREGLLLFSYLELKNVNSNGYSLILNNTSGGLSK